MPGFLGSISLLNLAALSAAVFLPLLVLAYRKRDKRTVYTISSLLCFGDLKKTKLPRARIQLPPRFFVELLALLLLLLAAALPLMEQQQGHTILLVDNSLSMSAVGNGASRWDQALTKAQDWLSRDSAGNSYTIYTTTPSLVQQGIARSTKSAAAEQLSKLKIAAGQDALEAAIEQLSSSESYGRLVIVTDKVASSAALALHSNVEVLSLDQPAANVFFKNVTLVESKNAGSQRRVIEAQIYNASSQPSQLTLSLFGMPNSEASGSEIELFSLPVKIAAEEQKSITLPLPQNLGGLSLFRLKIDAAQDAIASDSVAWISLDSSQNSSLLLISASQTDDALGLAKIPGLQVQAISPEQFSELSASQIEQYRGLVFHRINPLRAYRVPMMAVAPAQGSGLFQVAGFIEDIQVSSWLDHHPLTAYLQMPLLSGGSGVSLKSQPWLQPVISSTQGAIVVAGESEGVKFLGVGLELFPFEGAKSPALSVLTLNALHWLTGTSASASGYVVGDTIAARQISAQLVVSPSKEITELKAGQNYTAKEPGVFRFVDSARKEEHVAVNAIFPSESLSHSKQEFAFKLSTRPVVEDNQGSQPLWTVFSVLAALLFAFEYFLRRREEQLKSSPV